MDAGRKPPSPLEDPAFAGVLTSPDNGRPLEFDRSTVLRSDDGSLAYPVVDGVPILLPGNHAAVPDRRNPAGVPIRPDLLDNFEEDADHHGAPFGRAPAWSDSPVKNPSGASGH